MENKKLNDYVWNNISALNNALVSAYRAGAEAERMFGRKSSDIRFEEDQMAKADLEKTQNDEDRAFWESVNGKGAYA